MLLISLNAKSIDYEKNDCITQFVIEWLQTPYKWGGTSKKGIDCSAYVQKLYRRVFNIEIPRTCVMQYKKCKKIKQTELEAGDLVFFHINQYWHVGVYLTNGRFTHSGVSNGVWVSDLNDKYWQQYYFSSGRIS